MKKNIKKNTKNNNIKNNKFYKFFEIFIFVQFFWLVVIGFFNVLSAFLNYVKDFNESLHYIFAFFSWYIYPVFSKINYTFFRYLFQTNYTISYIINYIFRLISSNLLYFIVSLILYTAFIVLFYRLLKYKKELLCKIVSILSVILVFVTIGSLYRYLSDFILYRYFYSFSLYTLTFSPTIFIIFLFLALVVNFTITYFLLINKSTKIKLFKKKKR